MHKDRLIASCSVLIGVLAGAAVYAADNSFTVIGLPDTQKYSESYPSIFHDQTQWIADNRTSHDIRFVSHYGDLVQHGTSADEWSVAKTAMSRLDSANIAYGTAAGNHDVLPSGGLGQTYSNTNYLTNFGPQHYTGKSWYGGASPSGMSNYQYVDAGDQTFLSLHLDVETPIAELAWAQGVLNKNRDKPTMITTHRYMQDAEDYTAGVPIVASGRYPDIWYTFEGQYTPNGIKADEFFDTFVATNPQVFMVNCGHFHEQYRQTSTNRYGMTVHEVLADYQDDPNGGNGYMRIMDFNTDLNRIDVQSYSPTLNQYRTDNESQFSLNIDFDAYASLDPTCVFQQGINGYNGTRDTWINQNSRNSSYGNNSTMVVDDDTTNSWFSDRRGHGMLRFDDIFTSTGEEGKIPYGATITEATLRVTLADDIDIPFYDPDFDIYMMIRDWGESSTWNSMGSGLSYGSDYGQYLGQFNGDNVPNGDYYREINVLAALQSWATGSPNYGFAIAPEIISGNDDGIDIWSSEYGNPLLRPMLDVSYVYTSVVPEPGTLALLVIFSTCLTLRRREYP